MKKSKIFLAFFGLGLFICLSAGLVKAGAIFAAERLYLEPASGTYAVGETFTVKVKVDTTKEAMASDAIITFDALKLEVSGVSAGGFFSGFDYNISNDTGKLSIYAFSEQALQTKTGSGDLALISFKGKATGTASVTFVCQTGSNTDSAIWDPQGTDLIDCASVGSGNYTIGSGTTVPTNTATPTSVPAGGSTSIPTATSAPGSTATPTSSQLPQTGIELPTMIMIFGGILLGALGVAVAIR